MWCGCPLEEPQPTQQLEKSSNENMQGEIETFGLDVPLSCSSVKEEFKEERREEAPAKNNSSVGDTVVHWKSQLTPLVHMPHCCILDCDSQEKPVDIVASSSSIAKLCLAEDDGKALS